ncbi:hypothetical protein [Paraburkholderia bannensis]|uniref:hypothetical protein n=1 Tax=Paraburkholderia bannensis TaxID=765414 RepID=UPI002AB0F09B|nr:hypothetical protein [Paraburkholderia bannensis]
MAGSEFGICTADNPGALFGNPGLLGVGSAPGIGAGRGSDVSRVLFDIGGRYAADPGAASRYLISQLKYDSDLAPADRVNVLMQLRLALRDAEKSLNKTEFGKLYKEAQSVPGLGGDILNAIYSPSNISASIASGAGAAMSQVQKASTSELLELPDDVRAKLLAWANKGGNQGIKSFQKRFGKTLELLRVEGQWVVEIPVNKKAAGYVIKGKSAQNVMRIPAYRQATLDALEARNKLNLEGFGKSMGGQITGVGVGGLLAFGPQAILDAIDADNMHQFASLEAHSQPANAAGWLAGWAAGAVAPAVAVMIVGAPVELPVIAVLAIGYGVGISAQIVFSHLYGKRVGDAWDEFAAKHHW